TDECLNRPAQERGQTIRETDIDDVVQVNNVFVNVSKGEVARSEDLKKAFGKLSTDDIVKEILQRGEIQVGEKEREHELSNLWKEIATLISERCVDPETQGPIPVGMIEKAMHEAGFSVKQGKTAKSQTGECIRLIQTNSKLPIQRARMRIKVVIANEQSETVREETLLIDPSQFKVLNELIQKKADGKVHDFTPFFCNLKSPKPAILCLNSSAQSE
ncbi:7689_t:CDS:2, partial [Acaulospora colombiana]